MFCILDPVVTVHPDRVLFEVFAKDESTYACLSFGRDAFDEVGETKCGTTNIDFSAALQRLGVKRLDYAVLSHAHTDHFTGLTPALDLLPSDCAARVYDPGLNRSDVDGYVAFKRAAGCRYKKVGIGQTLNLDTRVETTVLSAYAQKQSNDDSHGVNNTSVVLRLRYGRFSMLLSGDAEAEAEGGMVSGALPLRSTILKAGHHGSCTASSDGYLRAVKPKYIVISAGTGNNYGLPHCQTIAKYRAISGLRWARTDRNGALTIVSDGTTVWLYDEDLNQVTIRKLGDTVSEQPLALLLDPTAADKLFELKALDPAGSIGYVEAKSKKADAPFTDLRVAMVALQPKELTWRDALQNANTIRFGDLAKNGKLGADAFSFTPPKGADVLKQ